MRTDPILEIDQHEYAEMLETLIKPHGDADIARRYELSPYIEYKLIVHKDWCAWIPKCNCGARS